MEGASASLSTTTPRRYTLLRRLAIGGMGELFLAGTMAPGGVQKLVAIKRIRPEYANDPEFVKMFLNEARLAATLDHPNVVRTYDLVEEEAGFAMVMEYLHGASLGAVLNAVVGSGGRVPLEQIISIALGVSAGLHAAHERCGVDGRPLDIVHRDLSPGNVFITYEGGVKLLDFGIAKATSRTAITIGPSRKGKVSYMSPEQCVGHDVDRRSDVFGLGVVLWELCTGRRLFRGDNEFSIMNQITTIDAPEAVSVEPELPRGLSDLLRRALQRDRDDRFQTAMEFHDAIESFAREAGSMPSQASLGRYLIETCGRTPYPSVEPDSEFRDRQDTIVGGIHTPPPPAPTRRWSLVLAVAGGATLGALAMAFPLMADDPAPSGQQSPPAVQPAAAQAPPPETRSEPTVVAEQVDPEPAPEPQPEAAAEEERDVEHAAQPEKRRKKPRRKKKPKPKAKPEKDVARGVDGLLPRG